MVTAAGRPIRRGDVWLAALDPTQGSEIRKTRPCLIVSPPEMHDNLRTLIAAPMTTANKLTRFRVGVTFEGKSALILLDQMRALDKSRLIRRMGSVDQKTLNETLGKLRAAFEE